MKRTTKTHPKYPGRIRPAGLGRQEIVEALAEVGEATCTELERLCDMSNPSVNDAMRRLRADGLVHVKCWSRVGAKGSFSRVWVLGPGVDAPRPAPPTRVRKSSPFRDDAGERTPGIPMDYVIKSVFVGGKNPWAGIDVSQMRNKIGASTTERQTP